MMKNIDNTITLDTVDTLRAQRAVKEMELAAASAAAQRALALHRSETPILIRLVEIEQERDALLAQLNDVRTSFVVATLPMADASAAIDADDVPSNTSKTVQETTESKSQPKPRKTRRKSAKAKCATGNVHSFGVNTPVSADAVKAVLDIIGDRKRGLLSPIDGAEAQAVLSALEPTGRTSCNDVGPDGMIRDTFSFTIDGSDTYILFTNQDDGLAWSFRSKARRTRKGKAAAK